nr:hypothetical protein [Hymenobacter sp. BRD67]
MPQNTVAQTGQGSKHAVPGGDGSAAHNTHSPAFVSKYVSRWH